PRSIYSRDANLWHISHEGGELEGAWHAPGPEVLVYCVPTEEAPDRPEEVVITFAAGVTVAVDGEPLRTVELVAHPNERGGAADGERLLPVALVAHLDARAGAHGVGIV